MYYICTVHTPGAWLSGVLSLISIAQLLDVWLGKLCCGW